MAEHTWRNLAELFADIPLRPIPLQTLPEIPISGVVFDSRQVQPGSLFVALTGGVTDGHHYITAAVERGAAAVIGQQPVHNCPVPFIQVEDSKFALAHLAAAFYGFPARQLTVIGVTGTDGKTTTSNLVYQILLAAGLRAGMISTVNAVIGSEILDTGFHVTTPEAPDVQRYLRRMVEAGLTHVVLESTSHGLAQHRVTACEFDIGIVTNITHEHLDYHGSYESYRAAKARLFTELAITCQKAQGNPRLGVLNQDDTSYDFLKTITPVKTAAYGLSNMAEVWADDIENRTDGAHFIAVGPGFRQPIDCNLLGDFNISNCLAAITATVVGLGILPEVAARGIQQLPGVPGRMEAIQMGQNFAAIVDFAHTPNALRVALQTVRKLTSNRVIVVFGSAGLRDRAKRRMMAEVSLELADMTILTAEDPRTESLDEILAEMAKAASKNGGVEGINFIRIPDRGEAIRQAVEMAQAGDLVIACGKGHEQSMCFGQVEYAWDDRVAMRAALAGRLGIPGPAMPVLPTSQEG